MNKEKLKRITQVWCDIAIKDQRIKDFFGCNDYMFGEETHKIQEFILDYIGFPEDNSAKKEYGTDKDWFCRDWFHDQFYQCLDGKFSLNELVELLIEESKEFV